MDFHEIFMSMDQYGLGNGLVFKRRYAIAWTDCDQDGGHHMVSLVPNNLINI